MHRDKTVARIVLVLSIVHGALAAPVVVRQRYLEVAGDVSAASEKRSSDDKSPHLGSEVAPDELNDSYFTARSSPSGPNRYLTKPVSGALELHDDPPPARGTLQMRDDPPGTSGTPPSRDHPPLAPGTPELHNDPPPTSGAPSSQNDPSPAPGDPQLHNNPTTSTLGTPDVHDDLSPGKFDDTYRWLNDYRFPGATPSGLSHSDSEALGVSHSALQLHNDPLVGSEGLQLHNNPSPSNWRTIGEILQGGPSSPWSSLYSESGSHSELQLHNNPSPSNWRTIGEIVHGGPSSPWSSLYSESDSEGSQTTNSKAEGFFNDARKKKLKLYGKIGATIGISAAILYGLGKVLVPFEPKSGPVGGNLASSEVVDHGASMHPRSPKKPVSHALALASLMTRNEDLQLPSVLTK